MDRFFVLREDLRLRPPFSIGTLLLLLDIVLVLLLDIEGVRFDFLLFGVAGGISGTELVLPFCGEFPRPTALLSAPFIPPNAPCISFKKPI